MKDKTKKKTKLDDWFSDHVVIMGSDDAVIKGVEEKIKNHLINGTQFGNDTDELSRYPNIYHEEDYGETRNGQNFSDENEK
jgi:hypothetical protein